MPEGSRQESAGLAVAPPARRDGASAERGAGKLRFALGMFDDASHAARAIVELAETGVARGDVDLVARQQVLSEFQDALGHLQPRPPPRAVRLVRCRPVPGAFPWAFDVVEGGSSEQPPATEIRHLALSRLADQVLELLRSNGGVVIVRLLDDRQQQSVCSMLLRHAAAGVQTHEVRRAGTGGTPA